MSSSLRTSDAQRSRAFQPYAGVGLVDALISTKDGVGWAVEGGFDYFVNRNWSVFFDAKYLCLGVAATRTLGAPVTATVRLNPTILTGGLGYFSKHRTNSAYIR